MRRWWLHYLRRMQHSVLTAPLESTGCLGPNVVAKALCIRSFGGLGYATTCRIVAQHGDGTTGCFGSTSPSWSKARLFSSSSEDDVDVNSNSIDGDGGCQSERSGDEVVGRFEKLLQKWSSNTPLLLDNLQVQLDPVIVCGVLKKIPKPDVARKFFNWAKSQSGYQHNIYTYAAIIDHYGRAKNLSAMEQVVAEMQEEGCSLSILTFTSLMHWYRQGKNLAGVRRVWQRMHEEDYPHNEYTYTTYIDALTKGGCHQEAMEAFGKMQDSGCRPNVFTYTVLIHSLIEVGKLDGACDLFKRLSDLQYKPNSITYTTLVKAHGKAGDLEKALHFYKGMMDSGSTPSNSLRSFLAAALIAEGRVTEAEELCQITAAMVAENEKRKEKANSLPGGLPRPQRLAELLRDWGPETERALERVKVRLRHPYLSNVMTLVSGEPEVAWRYFEWVKAQEGYHPTKSMFAKVLDIVEKAGHIELQNKILGEAESAGTMSFNTLIMSYCKTKHTDAALQVFERMKEQGLKPSTQTFTMLIDLLSRTRTHTGALEMYGEMKKAKCKPTIQTYTVILHSLARSGKLDAANTLFEKLSTLNSPTTTVTYTIMMQAFLKTGDLKRALKLYESMQADGINPSRALLKMLTRGLHAAGMHHEVDALVNVET